MLTPKENVFGRGILTTEEIAMFLYKLPIDIQKYTIPIINCEAGNKKVELFFLNQIKEILDLDINQVSKNNKDKISLIC